MSKVVVALLERANHAMTMVPTRLLSLLARIAIANTFWSSVQTKITGWNFLGQSWQFWSLSDSTFMLFENEYVVPLLPVNLAAYMATFGEFFLSIAIILGLFTQLSALGLLLMTLVIQVFVYPDAWGVHILWATLLLYLMKHGGGALSVDHLLRKKTRPDIAAEFG